MCVCTSFGNLAGARLGCLWRRCVGAIINQLDLRQTDSKTLSHVFDGFYCQLSELAREGATNVREEEPQKQNCLVFIDVHQIQPSTQ